MTKTIASPGVALERKAMTWPDKARSLKVVDQVTYDCAADALKGIKDLRAELDAAFNPIIKKNREALETAREQKRKAADPLDEAERILKSMRIAYQQEQERVRQIEQARLNREAEERAAADRKREIEAAKVAGASRREVKALSEQPVFCAPITVAPAVQQAEGLSQRTVWKAEVQDIGKLVQHCCQNPQFMNLLEPNQVAINAMVRSLKNAAQIPGVRVWSETVESVRR